MTVVTSAQRILKDDLKLKSYRIIVQPKISEDQKTKRLKFANWIRTNFRKEDTLRFLFSDEKMFDIDDVYNSQNERIWVPSRADADAKGGISTQLECVSSPIIFFPVLSLYTQTMVVCLKCTCTNRNTKNFFYIKFRK